MAAPLPGWLWNAERLVEDATVDGCLARGVSLLASCRNAECSRRLTVDLHALSAMGWGRAPMQEIRALYPCRRRPKCDLAWTEIYPNGVPLQAYVDGKVDLRVSCDACRFEKLYAPTRLIQLLERKGRGDGNTGINEAAKRIRGACRCGVHKWRVDAAWPDPIKEKQAQNRAEEAAQAGREGVVQHGG